MKVLLLWRHNLLKMRFGYSRFVAATKANARDQTYITGIGAGRNRKGERGTYLDSIFSRNIRNFIGGFVEGGDETERQNPMRGNWGDVSRMTRTTVGA